MDSMFARAMSDDNVIEAVPALMNQAEEQGGANADNLSMIALRWEDKGGIGFYGVQQYPAPITDLDPNRPIYDGSHAYFDAFLSYRTKLFADRVSGILDAARRQPKPGVLQTSGRRRILVTAGEVFRAVADGAATFAVSEHAVWYRTDALWPAWYRRVFGTRFIAGSAEAGRGRGAGAGSALV